MILTLITLRGGLPSYLYVFRVLYPSIRDCLYSEGHPYYIYSPTSTNRGPCDLAVSSSPRPWIDVFALLKKFNMAVTESDLDPEVRTFK